MNEGREVEDGAFGREWTTPEYVESWLSSGWFFFELTDLSPQQHTSRMYILLSLGQRIAMCIYHYSFSTNSLAQLMVLFCLCPSPIAPSCALREHTRLCWCFVTTPVHSIINKPITPIPLPELSPGHASPHMQFLP